MNKIRLFLVPLALWSLSFKGVAFDCYLTIMKSNCWNKYTVNVSLHDDFTGNQLVSNVNIAPSTPWKRVKFTCDYRQSLNFKARFSPAVWKDDNRVAYKAKRIWHLPKKATSNIKAWEIPLCFPTDFSNVPIPPRANHMCTCAQVKALVPALPKPGKTVSGNKDDDPPKKSSK